MAEAPVAPRDEVAPAPLGPPADDAPHPKAPADVPAVESAGAGLDGKPAFVPADLAVDAPAAAQPVVPPTTDPVPAVTNGELKKDEAASSSGAAPAEMSVQAPVVAPKDGATETSKAEINSAATVAAPPEPASAEPEKPAQAADAPAAAAVPEVPAADPVAADTNGAASSKEDQVVADAPIDTAAAGSDPVAVSAPETKTGDKRPAEADPDPEPEGGEDAAEPAAGTNGKVSRVKKAFKKAVAPLTKKAKLSGKADPAPAVENGANGSKQPKPKREKKAPAPAGFTARKTRSQGPV